MRLYPINIDLRGKKIVVVGGGAIGLRKVRGLVRVQGDVTVIAPIVDARIRALVRQGRLRWLRRRYRRGDLQGATLAFGTTGLSAVNRMMRIEADYRKIPLNVADVPNLCHFTVPAQVSRGDLLVTVSTGGASPALAKQIRKSLERQIGPEYGQLTRFLGRLRLALKTYPMPGGARRLTRLVRSDAVRLIGKGDRRGFARLVRRIFSDPVAASVLGRGSL